MPHSLIVTQNLTQPLMTKSCQEYLSVVGYKTSLFNPIYLLSSFSIVIIGIIADRPIYVTYLLICLLNGLYVHVMTIRELLHSYIIRTLTVFFVLFFLFRFVVGVVLFNLHFHSFFFLFILFFFLLTIVLFVLLLYDYDFWLLLWYLQTCMSQKNTFVNILNVGSTDLIAGV